MAAWKLAVGPCGALGTGSFPALWRFSLTRLRPGSQETELSSKRPLSTSLPSLPGCSAGLSTGTGGGSRGVFPFCRDEG